SHRALSEHKTLSISWSHYLKSQLKIEEKMLSCYQSKITRKFGCKRYIRFMYLYSLNKEMVDERWLMPSI
ncbi:hypothetical protein ACVXJ7_28895, partial [Klebsiella pneumoniae]